MHLATSDHPRKLHIDWPTMMWKRLKQWSFLELALLLLFILVLLLFTGTEVGWIGIALVFSGFISVLVWYYLFVRVYEKAYTLDRIQMVTEFKRSGKPAEMAAYSHSPVTCRDEWGTFSSVRIPGRYWILIDDDIRTGLKTPGPLLIALFSFLWYLVWFSAMIGAFKNLDDEVDAIYEIMTATFTLVACGMITILINPRIGRPGVQ